ncbi:MAG: RNA polymerase sigma factor [Ilumatobacter sp.]
MTQFRPAPAIEEDRALAEAFRGGDDAAIRTLVERFGPHVTSLLTAHGETASTIEVFVQAWVASDEFEPGADFGPWLRSIAVDSLDGVVAPTDADEQRWQLVDATASFENSTHDALRSFHAEGGVLDPDAQRHELRLQRRLAHLGSDDEINAMLADPLVWVRAEEDLAGRVVARIAAASESGVDDGGEDSPPSRFSRSVRPVLLGIGGAIFVLFAAILVLSAAGGEVDEPAFTVDLIPTGRIVGVETGELIVTERDSGVELDLDAFSLPRRSGDQLYSVVLVLVDGTEVAAGSFNEAFGARLTAGVDLERVERLFIASSVLGGTPSEGAAVLKADFPSAG